MKLFYLFILMSAVASTAANSETIEDRLASIDLDKRMVILAEGQFFSVPEAISLEPMQAGQVVRVTADDGTIEATSIDILEQAPPEPVEE